VVSSPVNVPSSDLVHIGDPGHPVAAGVTIAGLDNWGQTAHGDFTSTGGLTAVFINTNTGLPVTIAGSTGLGKVVYSNMDLEFHFVGDTGIIAVNAMSFVTPEPASPFSAERQLYCNGGCTWAGGSGCDQADADILCKLTTGNPNSTAISWTDTTAQDFGGFSCPSAGVNLGPMPEFGVTVDVWYQESSILANHGPGQIILDPVCTNP
jgi:hypothetical protein